MVAIGHLAVAGLGIMGHRDVKG